MPLAYPVFVHCFLDLVEKAPLKFGMSWSCARFSLSHDGYRSESLVAQDFLSLHAPEHETTHLGEVQALTAVTTPALVEVRFAVSVCR